MLGASSGLTSHCWPTSNRRTTPRNHEHCSDIAVVTTAACRGHIVFNHSERRYCPSMCRYPVACALFSPGEDSVEQYKYLNAAISDENESMTVMWLSVLSFPTRINLRNGCHCFLMFVARLRLGPFGQQPVSVYDRPNRFVPNVSRANVR